MFEDLQFRLRSLFRRDTMEADMDEELRSHFEQQVEKLVAGGLPREEAIRRARLEFGGYEQLKEECRDARGVSAVETLLQDMRYAVHVLRKSPGFTVVGILTLALGIGANTAIFSVIDSVLLRPLPYKDPAGLVMLWENNSRHPNPHNTVSPPDFLDWQNRNSSFAEMASLFDERDNLTGNGLPQEVIVQDVSANFFSVLGVNPILGPGFRSENGKAGHDNVVILSYGFWKERFAGDSGIIGKTLVLNGKPQSIVGVAPRDFTWFIKDGSLTGAKPQIWTPFVFPASFSDRKDIGRFLSVVARLKPGVTVAQAQTEMNAITARIAEEYPDFNGYWGGNVVPVRDQISGELRPALLVLFGAVAFVLLIACANVSSLLLARASAREREIAVRTAIGAGPWRIASQLLTESILLALIGGAIGVALAVWGTNLLLTVSPKNLLDLHSVPIDWRVLSFAAGATLLAGLLFGFLPSYISAHSGISETLKEGGRGSSAGKQRRFARSAFVVAQLCLALVLLAGSGLLIRSFIRLAGVDPGFEASHLLTFKVSLPSSKYKTDAARLAFFRQLLTRISRLPGVRAASMNSFPPFSGLGSATGVHILSQPERSMMDLPVAAVRVIGPDYFATMQIPLREGRTFTEQELTEERHVVIMNQAFVDQYLKGVNPLGQKAVIYMKSLKESENTPSEIIGVVGDVRQMALNTPAEPTVYWPHPELVMSAMTVVVRTANDPLSLISGVRNELGQMDPEQPMASIATMDELLSGSLSRSRFTMLVLGLFAGLALVLASVGIYGVIAYGVAQRTQEFGIRIALGARRRDVLRLVLGQGTRLTLLGIGLGIIASLLVARLLATFLYGVSPTDPFTFGAVALLLAFVALVACYIPARRATRVDPMVALRYE
ncbi:MAG TPA: ABC transporter permease [Candidatus Acidoferrum sp.]|nr:ABC transporter permease [Candidatus Acidoferrum sp.]